MLEAIITGTILGLSAGFAPGPLLALLLSETLKYGWKSGLKIALAPLITDLPIIIISIVILNKLASFDLILAAISILGGIVVFYLGYENFRSSGIDADSLKETGPKSLRKGIMVNFLSPHPYLFWFSVGGPIFIKSWQENSTAALTFISIFYLLLVGSKILLACLFQGASSFLTGKWYKIIVKTLGLILFIFATMLFWEGFVLITE